MFSLPYIGVHHLLNTICFRCTMTLYQDMYVQVVIFVPSLSDGLVHTAISLLIHVFTR